MTTRTKRWAAAAAVIAAAAGASIGVAVASDGKLLQPVGDRGHWHLVFDDEFGGSSLNTSHWSPSRMNSSGLTAGFSNSELECFDPRQVSVAGGHLHLQLIPKGETCNGRQQRYASGVVTTEGKFSFTYGYLETRVWLPGHQVLTDWPAVWAVGSNWPTDGEIDVVESLGGQACYHFHNASGSPGGCSSDNFVGRYHTFGADWEPGSVTWYYDGRRVFRWTTGVTRAPMTLVIDLALAPGGPKDIPADLRVRYVRVWQH